MAPLFTGADISGKSRRRALLEPLYATGIRNSEACGIMPEDFEHPDVLIVRGKGNRERRVIYGGRARVVLDAYRLKRAEMLAGRSLTDLVKPAFFLSFGPHVGLQGLNVRSVGRILKQVAAVKGLDPKKYHPHLLRHCFSTHCHDNGMPVEVINKLLGHTKLFHDGHLFAGFNESDDDVLQPGASTRTQLIAGQHGCDTAKKRRRYGAAGGGVTGKMSTHCAIRGTNDHAGAA